MSLVTAVGLAVEIVLCVPLEPSRYQASTSMSDVVSPVQPVGLNFQVYVLEPDA